MKKLLLLIPILFLFLLTANATDYYIATNGNDNNNGTSSSTPWQSINKLNSYATKLRAGDRVFFRRGDTFYGRIEGSNGGRVGNPVIYSAYGSGEKPIITGFTKVNSWVNLGGNIWESSTAVSNLPTLNVVVINGLPTPMGRFPNAESKYPFYPNFFSFQSFTGSGYGYTTLTSSDLKGGTNWTGADIVVRSTQWILDRQKIVSHSGNNISYNGGTTDFHGKGFGFFIQNDARTLDVQNEWYYNPGTKKLRIYSNYSPSNVQVSSIDTLLNSNYNPSYKVYTMLENLSFVGANTTAISFNGNGGKMVPTISNCEVSFVGDFGISLSGLSDAVVENNLIKNSGSSAIWHTNGGNITIKSNTIISSGITSNYKANDYNGSSISLNSPNSLVQYNNIDSSAYCGIKFKGENVQIRNNFINHSTLVRGDGGGIYTAYANESGKVIDGNIILNSEGNGRGTPTDKYYGFGLYIDELGHYITVTNNTVANCTAAGLFLHDTKGITASNNTIYNNGTSGWANANLFIQGDGDRFTGVMRDHNFTNNIFFAKTKGQTAMQYYAYDNSNSVWTFGTLDNNYYVKPIEVNSAIQSYQSSSVITTMSLAQWKSFSGKDGNSKESPKSIVKEDELRFEYNASNQSKTISLDAKYIDSRGQTYNGSITLAPYSSAVLIRNGEVQYQSIVANAGSDQTIVLPTNSVNLIGEIKSGAGISYNWTKKSGPTSAKITSPDKISTSVTDLVQGIYVFELKVTDERGTNNLSSVQITVNSAGNLLPAISPSNTVNGLAYRYYEGSGFSVVPDFSKLSPVTTGYINNFDISVANRPEIFAFAFNGYIDVPTDGQYTFYTTSDDGSVLYIDNQLVVDNNGLHGAEERSGKIGLKAGKHAISVGFFQQTGGQVLNVNYDGPGISKRAIPNSVLYRDSPEILLPAVNPSNLVNGIDYSYHESSAYKVMPDFTIVSPIKTGTVANFDISVANKSEQFAINFTAFIDVPKDGHYTFYTSSDDGSMLYIDNVLIVNNDGLHGWKEESGIIGLEAGKHEISVRYFQGLGDKTLNVSYSGSGIPKQIIPASLLYRISDSEQLYPSVNPINTVNGLDYKYLEEGLFTKMPLFSNFSPLKTGTVKSFDLSVANRSEAFAINYTGYIDVPTDGQYTFYTTSDDGSLLYIDHMLVVDNNGLHGWQERSGKIGLKAGKHYISVEFFQGIGDKSLGVYFDGPGITKRLVSPSNLYRNNNSNAIGKGGFEGGALASTKPFKDQLLNNSNEIGIKAYPNPFVNSVVVTLSGEAGQFQLQMSDAVGRILWTRSGSKNEGFYQQSINTSSLQKGIYFLKVIQNKKSSIIKLLK